MRIGRTQPWYVASLAVGLAAIAIDTSAKKAASDGMVGMARLMVDRVPLKVRDSAKREASAAAQRSDTLSLIGFCVAAASAACLLISIHKHSLRRNSVPVAVLIAYIFLFLVSV